MIITTDNFFDTFFRCMRECLPYIPSNDPIYTFVKSIEYDNINGQTLFTEIKSLSAEIKRIADKIDTHQVIYSKDKERLKRTISTLTDFINQSPVNDEIFGTQLVDSYKRYLFKRHNNFNLQQPAITTHFFNNPKCELDLPSSSETRQDLQDKPDAQNDGAPPSSPRPW